MNNLENQVYETFEQDPVKYREYENAIYRCLLDRVHNNDADKITTYIHIYTYMLQLYIYKYYIQNL